MNEQPTSTPLEWLAIEVAVSAPARFNIHGTKAYIPRALIEQLRQELERQNVDWRAIQRARKGTA